MGSKARVDVVRGNETGFRENGSCCGNIDTSFCELFATSHQKLDILVGET